MTASNIALIAVAVIAIFGAIGAFTVAFRRSQSVDKPEPTAGVSAETLKADRSMSGMTISPRVEPPEPEPAVVEAEPEAAVEEHQPDSAIQIIESQRIVEVSPEEGGVTRRQFFNRALTATFGSFLALQGLYYLAFFWPKLTGGFGADIDAGPVSDLQTQVYASDGSVLPLFIPEAKAYLVPAPAKLSDQFAGKNVEAEGLMALFQRCVHLGCRVPWCATSKGFECPCHGSKYDSIGEYFAGPAPRNLDRFQVEIRGSNFVIKTGTIIQTPRAPERTVEYPQGPSCIGAA
ncbi:MAG: ubiquinol-cytochrome c reductase iron-sulfur subunit [Acidimicrobiia bacterium]|jgi:cytochrome b6-f complex iron-sulfur subunit